MATRLVPSADEASPYHLPPSALPAGVHVAPELAEMLRPPPSRPTMSLLPSADDATELKVPGVVRAVQLAPESVDVNTPPKKLSSATATSLVPSAEEATAHQRRG